MTTSAGAHSAEISSDTAANDLDHLVERARQGDESAWQRLVAEYTALLWWTARAHRLSEADAADAVQVTWLRCVQYLDRVRTPHLLPAWLVTTCHRECLRAIRGRAREVPIDIADPASPFARLADLSVAADPAEPVLAQELAAVLDEAIGRLPERQQRVLRRLMLVARDDETGYAEIAAALEMPQGSLGPTRQRALRRLRQDARVVQLHRS
jgi:RNA polymerase sigma factor (sigma-70 family)